MKKRIALISDIHGNLEALNSILMDIEIQDIDEIICLGDTISIGPNSKECIDILIKNNIKSVLGNCEIYLLKGMNFNHSIVKEEKEHYKWVSDSLTNKEIEYIENCPLYYEINIQYEDLKLNKKYILCHYLISNEKYIYPFEKNHLKKDINLWKKFNNDSIIYFIGHVHQSFNINDVDGIFGDFIVDKEKLTNIEIVESAGCTKDEYTSYTIIEISKNTKFQSRKIKYDRKSFINKVKNIEFPYKKSILKNFYGIEQ